MRTRAAWWGVAALFLVHGLVVSTWVSRIASVKSSLRLSDGALGLALLGTAVGSVAAIPVCGWIVSRYGSRRAALWTAIGFSISLFLPALAAGTMTLFCALLVYGAMAGANDVAMNAHAVGIEKMLGKPTMSRFHAMFSLAGMVGAAAGGVVASRGISPLAHLVAASVLVLVLTMWTAPLRIETRAASEPETRLSLWRIPMPLVALSAIGFCIFLSEGAIADWTAVYLKQVLNAGPGVAAAGYAAFSAAMAVFRFTGDAVTVWLGRARTIRAGALTAAFGLAIVVTASSPYWAMAGFAAAGMGFSSIIPLVFAAGGRIASVSEGAGVATVSGLGYLGFLVGPPAIGFISELTSLRAGLGLLVVLSAVAAALVSVAERTEEQTTSNPLAAEAAV